MTFLQNRGFSWILIAGFSVLLLWLLGPVLTPFVVAGILAYALTPLVRRLDQWSKRWQRPAVQQLLHVLAVLVIELVFFILLLGLVLLILPIVAKELPLLRDQLPVLGEQINTRLAPWLAQFGIHAALDVPSLKAFALKYFSANVEDVTASLLSSLKLGGSVALALVGNAVLIPVALFYLMKDWDNFVNRIWQLVPPYMRNSFDRFTQEADEVLGQYLRGQMLVMFIMALFYAIGLSLFGLDLALPIGIFTGLAMFIPYLGFGIGLVMALLAGLLEFSSLKALVMVAVVYGFGQILESFYLTPRLVGERIGLHPLAVIFALLAFGQLLGFVGVLIALPTSALLLVAMRRLRSSYFASPLYHQAP